MKENTKIYCTACGKKKEEQYIARRNKCSPKGLCKTCKSIRDRKYRESHKEQIAKHKHDKWFSDPGVRIKNKLYKEKRRTGMDATEFVKDKKCELCGITNIKHKEKFNERLHIHHKNNDGRKNIRLGKDPNHEDLQILCRPCHVIEDNKNRDYTGRGKKIQETKRRNRETAKC